MHDIVVCDRWRQLDFNADHAASGLDDEINLVAAAQGSEIEGLRLSRLSEHADRERHE